MPSWVGRLIKTDQFESLLFDRNQSPSVAQTAVNPSSQLPGGQETKSSYLSELHIQPDVSLNKITHPARKI